MARSRISFIAGAAAAFSFRSHGATAAAALSEAASTEALVAGSRRRFPNPLLVTNTGRKVRFYDDLVRGRFVFLTFAYTRCAGKCPASLSRLLEARALVAPRLGHAPDLVTLTLDPEHDTPEALATYVAAHGAPAGWTCVTGAPADLERLRRFLGFTDPDPRVDADRSQHGALVAMGNDRTGRWQVASTAAGPEQIALLALRTAGLRPTA
jgi:protein SCO1/2